MKACTHCKQTLPLNSFRKNTGTPSGIASWCAACTDLQRLEKRHGGQVKFCKECHVPSKGVKESGLCRTCFWKMRRDEILAAGEKECSHCKSTKSLTDFYHHASSLLGYMSQCKACTDESNVARKAQRRG